MRGLRGLAILLAVLAVSACAAPEGAWPGAGSGTGAGPGAGTEPTPRLPDVPDAFRAELLGGRSPDCRLRGQAIYLGGGRFLTAAHLVDDMVPRLRNCTGIPLAPLVVFRGHALPVRLVRLGEGKLEPDVGPVYRRGEDLALLQATGALPDAGLLSERGARPCPDGPARGQAVVVLSGQRHEAEAGGMVPERRAADGGYADLPLHLVQGESGAGVFDARSFCLLGVVSHRPDQTPDHSRIVPAATIRTFLGEVQGLSGGGAAEGGGASGGDAGRGMVDTAGRIGAPGA